MKCLKCNREMIYDGCDYYHCDKGGAVAHDLVCRDISKVKDFGFGIIKENQDMQFYQQGWVCPKCGAVMSPSQPYCLFCQSNNIRDIQVTYTGITPTINTENKSISRGE